MGAQQSSLPALGKHKPRRSSSGPGGEPRRGECLERKQATQPRGRKRFAEQTCHIFKGECCWGIATGITLLIPHPSLVQILHEAVLVGPESTSRQDRAVTGDQPRAAGAHAFCAFTPSILACSLQAQRPVTCSHLADGVCVHTRVLIWLLHRGTRSVVPGCTARARALSCAQTVLHELRVRTRPQAPGASAPSVRAASWPAGRDGADGRRLCSETGCRELTWTTSLVPSCSTPPPARATEGLHPNPVWGSPAPSRSGQGQTCCLAAPCCAA